MLLIRNLKGNFHNSKIRLYDSIGKLFRNISMKMILEALLRKIVTEITVCPTSIETVQKTLTVGFTMRKDSKHFPKIPKMS